MNVLNEVQLYSKTLLKHTTPVGHIWHAVTWMGRVMPLLVSVNGIYGDDLFQFKCDTMHPGCRELCFNKFSPMSHTRFFFFLLLSIHVPKIAAVFYLRYQELSSDKSRMVEEKRIRDELPANMPLAAKMQQAKQRTANLPNEKFERSKPKRNLDRGIIEQVYITKKIKIAQFLHYLGVLIIEFLGLLILNWNQQAGNGKYVGAKNEKYQFDFFNFSEYFYPWKGIDMGLYECKDIKTCHNTDGNSQKCFIVRPFEKNFYIGWMITMASISIILLIIDIIYLSQHHIKKDKSKKAKLNNGSETGSRTGSRTGSKAGSRPPSQASVRSRNGNSVAKTRTGTLPPPYNKNATSNNQPIVQPAKYPNLNVQGNPSGQQQPTKPENGP